MRIHQQKLSSLFEAVPDPALSLTRLLQAMTGSFSVKTSTWSRIRLKLFFSAINDSTPAFEKGTTPLENSSTCSLSEISLLSTDCFPVLNWAVKSWSTTALLELTSRFIAWLRSDISAISRYTLKSILASLLVDSSDTSNGVNSFCSRILASDGSWWYCSLLVYT